ncbi:hypothetical protein ACHAWF_001249 [Thalassiosira exigua]
MGGSSGGRSLRVRVRVRSLAVLLLSLGAWATISNVRRIARLERGGDADRLGFDAPKNGDAPGRRRRRSTEEEAFATDFAFPSVEERLAYYAGDWRGRSLARGDVPCDALKRVDVSTCDVPVLWRTPSMEAEVRRNATRDWVARTYLKDALGVAKAGGGSGGGGGEDSFVLVFGDSHSLDPRLPAVAKTRFSNYARDASTLRPMFRNIVWPVGTNRHYGPLQQLRNLEREGKSTRWEDKKETLIWRGGATGIEGVKNRTAGHPDGGPRLDAVRKYFRANVSDVDVAFKAGDRSLRKLPKKYAREGFMARTTHVGMAQQLRHKYVLSLEGNDVATGLKWQLASNSVVFMSRPVAASYLMEDLLVPYVHYVPLNEDRSDLLEMVEWARRNDERCRWISERATEYMERVWMSEEAKREKDEIRKGLGREYRERFGEALRACWPD